MTWGDSSSRGDGAVERAQEQLATRQVEARGRLVEDEQLGVGRERAREQDSCALAFGARGEQTRPERPGTDALEQHVGAREVRVFLRQDRAREARRDDLARRLHRVETPAERRLDDADPAAQLRHRHPPEEAAEHERLAAARPQLR